MAHCYVLVVVYNTSVSLTTLCVVTGHSVSTGDETTTFVPPEVFFDAVLTH